MSKEHSYAYEAGYRDGAINYELDHCPACKNVADLQEVLDENAKLRELVRDMYKAFMHGNCYRWCEFKEPCNYISDGRCQWYDRMRKLGVEVNE